MRIVIGFLLCAVVFPAIASPADTPVRARDLGVPFVGTPGPLNAITDVKGVAVGHSTIIKDLPEHRAVRTGVTAILPRGPATLVKPVAAGWFALNGNGEMTGTTWVEESGFLSGPIMITNTLSVGTVDQATIAWGIAHANAASGAPAWALPVVAETWDGYLNDIKGFHVKPEHVYAAIEGASSGPVEEGNVGGGTGMICHEFKCGIGTSSRVVEVGSERYTVGVLVQANYGLRETLRIAGVPVGQILTKHRVFSGAKPPEAETGSIIIVIATDAPLLPHQLERLAKRASLGMARMGGMSGNGSGDIFIAFSTADAVAIQPPTITVKMLLNDAIDPLFNATVRATEESIVNAMIAARDMTGDQGHTVYAIDHQALRKILREYNRLAE